MRNTPDPDQSLSSLLVPPEIDRRQPRLLENLLDGFVSLSLSGQILEFNEPFRAMLGYDREELRSLTHDDVTPVAWQEKDAAIIGAQVLKRGYSDVYEKEYRRSDGSVVPVKLRTILVPDDKGGPGLLWVIVRDLTEQRDSESLLAELRQHLEAEHEVLARKEAALREVLDHIDAEKKRIRSHISTNLDMAVIPLVKRMKRLSAKNQQLSKLVDLLGHAIENITAPFLTTIAEQYLSLSPRELQVCVLVSRGLQSKEIAEHLGISVLTVSKVRQQVRSKVGIRNGKISLAEYLRDERRHSHGRRSAL